MAIRSRKTAEPLVYAVTKALNESRKHTLSTVTNADGTDAATNSTLVNEIKDMLNALASVHYDATAAQANQGDFRDPEATVEAVSPDDSTDLATLLVLTADIKRVYDRHVEDTHAHIIADVTNVVTNVDATDLTTANVLLIEIKADYNAHLSESGVHPNDDGTNVITNADSTDQATADVLAIELKDDINLHVADALTGNSVELEAP